MERKKRRTGEKVLLMEMKRWTNNGLSERPKGERKCTGHTGFIMNGLLYVLVMILGVSLEFSQLRKLLGGNVELKVWMWE